MSEFSESTKTIGVFNSPMNKKLIELYKSQGKNVLEFPPISTETVIPNADQTNLFEKINDYDWLIFTDIWTVEHFFELPEAESFDLFELDNRRICACGEAIADALRFRQIHSDVIPAKNENATIISSIADYIFNADELKNSKFAIIKAQGNDSHFADNLKAHASSVVEYEIYKDQIWDEKEFSKLKALIIGGAVDEFVFSSPLDVYSLGKIVGQQNLSSILKSFEVSAMNELTSRTVQENE